MAAKSASPASAQILSEIGLVDLPDDWAIVRIEDLLSSDRGISVGVMYPGDHHPHGIPLIKAGDLSGSRINSTPEYRISPEKHSEYRRTELAGGELLISLVGDVGRCAIVPSSMAGWNAARAVAVLRFHSESEANFVRACLLSPPFQHLMRAWSTTTVQATLNLKEIRQIPLPWPPSSMRDAIANILGTLDDKIELNRRRNQTLEAMARALFKDWFVDFGPVRAKMEGQEPYLPAEIWELFPERLDDEGKPEGWELIPLNGLASLETSSISPSKSPEAVFEHYSIPAFDAGGMPAMELGDSIKSNKYKVHTDAVLVSKLNPQTPRIWLPTVATDHAVCSTEFMQLVPRKRDDRPFLYCLMVSEVMQAEVLRHVTGSTGSRQRAQPSQIAKVEVLLPEPNILSAFNRKAEPLLRAIADNQRESQTLTQLRDTLLPKLISGELRIAEAVKFLEKSL